MGTFTSNSIDGEVYIQRLASYIRHNEEALANGLLSFSKFNNNLKFKPLRLNFTIHHLYYVTEKIDQSPLDVDVGPLNIKLDNPNHEPTFISFMANNAKSNNFESDAKSISSINSVKSMVSSASVYWKSIGFSKDPMVINKDLKYLYSSFTKLPCLILTPKTKINSIMSYEEYPCDTSVPLKMFKNLQVLELIDYEPNEIYGWDILSEQLRILIIKNSKISDISEILFNLVLDDENGRSSFTTYSNSRKYSSESVNDKVYSPNSATTSLNFETSPHLNDLYASSLPQEFSFNDLSDSNNFNFNFNTNQPPATYHNNSSNHSNSNSNLNRHKKSNSTSSLNNFHYYGHNNHINYHQRHKSQTSINVNYETLAPRKWSLLKQLTISETSITTIPSHIFKPFQHLVKLNLSHNLLDKIPPGLTHIVNLKYLNLSDNYIESLEGLPSNLPNLISINLNNNKLKDLNSLQDLVSIEKIDLRRNLLIELDCLKPVVLQYIKNNKFLNLFLSGNQLPKSYRIDLFNLYNGVRYKNSLKIDDSVPGYFESAMLLDSSNAFKNLKKFLDLDDFDDDDEEEEEVVVSKNAAEEDFDKTEVNEECEITEIIDTVTNLNLDEVLKSTTIENNQFNTKKTINHPSNEKIPKSNTNSNISSLISSNNISSQRSSVPLSPIQNIMNHSMDKNEPSQERNYIVTSGSSQNIKRSTITSTTIGKSVTQLELDNGPISNSKSSVRIY